MHIVFTYYFYVRFSCFFPWLFFSPSVCLVRHPLPLRCCPAWLCLTRYVASQITDGQPYIQCPAFQEGDGSRCVVQACHHCCQERWKPFHLLIAGKLYLSAVVNPPEYFNNSEDFAIACFQQMTCRGHKINATLWELSILWEPSTVSSMHLHHKSSRIITNRFEAGIFPNPQVSTNSHNDAQQRFTTNEIPPLILKGVLKWKSEIGIDVEKSKANLIKKKAM